ncbi:MAG: amidohydrolase [Chloroflexi bacterium]|nr:amidohydrolase [Chloroflexota bacterium]
MPSCVTGNSVSRENDYNALVIIDSHTHLFSPEVIAQRERYAARDAFFGALYSGAVARMVGADELIAAMDAAGVDRAVVAGWCWQANEICVEQNSWLMDIARQYPDRVSVLATVQPNAGADAIRELHRCVEGGVVGVGELNADGQGFRLDDPGLMNLARELSDLGLPLMLHTNEPVGHVYPGKGKLAPAEIYAFVKAFPDLRIVLAHWGGGFPFYELMREVRKIARNVFYDSAASPLLYDIGIFRAVTNIVGSDKILFGSDFPLLLYPKRQREPSMDLFLNDIRAAGLSDDDLRNILGENAMRVVGARHLQNRATDVK